ncbi:ABC transporter permease [Larkinella sp. VNQ87]|uniref:ABC transporter permease n=1 Tax=Larkinella sp. VNQ87 TaxID=3400921 RepID=UPI003C0240C3
MASTPQPPRWAERLLRWWGHPDTREEVQGDLLELYAHWVQTVGERKARWRYSLSVLKLLRPLARQKQTEYSTPFFLSPPMLHNYLKIAFRNLVRQKAYSLINIGGLAVGMAVALLIGLWIYDELSFNTYHRNYDRIAQIVLNQSVNGELHTSKSLPYPFVHELKSKYSSPFKHIVTSTHPDDCILTAGETKLSKRGQFMDAKAPEMLTLKMVKGTWAGLQDPQSILLSASTAKALFGDADPMGKPLKINTDKLLKVTGVYEDFPQNTEFHDTQFVASWEYFVATNQYMREKKWDNHALYMYVELNPNTDFDKATATIKDAELNAIRNLESMKEEAATHPQLWLHPMRDWHLYSDFKNGVVGKGPVQYVWMVGLIGFFVLLLACINFMNLSTARSEKRAKEVGIRKTVGSQRSQLVGQFFSESLLVVFLAFLIALLLATVSLSWFNDLAAKQMRMPWDKGYFWLFSLGFIALTSVLAGSYPALYLTSFQPVKVLKGAGLGRLPMGRLASVPRKVLVVTQFTVSISLIICTLVVYRQIQFARNRPVGYSRDGLLMVPMQSGDFYEKTALLRQELKNTGVVLEVAESQSPVTGVWSSNEGFSWKGMPPGFTERFATLTVSPEYAETVGWQFIDGRNFSKELASDSAGFVINETAAKLMGFRHPVGETVRWKSKWMTDNIEKQYRILGVVKDMVMESPFKPIKPTVFFLFGSPNWINIKIKPGVDAGNALSQLETVFKKLIPAAPFEYKFADQEYDAKFRAEERIGKLATFFAVLAVFISCLGLFGLASFVAEQRTKEIGVRKVLGASVLNLWGLLSKDFVVLVLIAFGVATPIAHYFLSNWLQQYQYRTEISWWIFAAVGFAALLITLLTVSFQSIKAALMNPVCSLRSE